MKFTAKEILLMKEPGELFTDNIDTIKNEYIQLGKRWHPDLNDNSDEANEIMKIINDLYNQGLDLIKQGIWKKPGQIKLFSKEGKHYEINYRVSHPFQLGTMYISNTVVLYLIEREHKDLYENALKTMNNFTYANDNMKEEVSKYLPTIVAKFETNDNKFAVVVKKTSDLYTLRDILDYYDGKIPERHVAWILSSLYNLVCYLNYAKISHNDISLDSYFISPLYHGGALLGGWWYTVPIEQEMIGVTEETYSIMPPKVKDTGLGSITTDLETIRLIGRKILGDKNGTKLMDMGNIPAPLVNWVRGVSTSTAFDEYKKWNKTLDESFGKRQFIEMKINDTELYTKIKNKNIGGM